MMGILTVASFIASSFWESHFQLSLSHRCALVRDGELSASGSAVAGGDAAAKDGSKKGAANRLTFSAGAAAYSGMAPLPASPPVSLASAASRAKRSIFAAAERSRGGSGAAAAGGSVKSAAAGVDWGKRFERAELLSAPAECAVEEAAGVTSDEGGERAVDTMRVARMARPPCREIESRTRSSAGASEASL